MTQKTEENLLRAKKKIQSMLKTQNRIIIKFGYDTQLILSYEDGLKLLEALTKAEKFVENYNKPSGIEPINKETFSIMYMSNEEYEHRKMARLLGMTYEEVKEAALAVDL